MARRSDFAASQTTSYLSYVSHRNTTGQKGMHHRTLCAPRYTFWVPPVLSGGHEERGDGTASEAHNRARQRRGRVDKRWSLVGSRYDVCAGDFAFDDDTGLLRWVADDRAVVALRDVKDAEAKQPALVDVVNRWVVT